MVTGKLEFSGSRLRLARTLQGWTQAELADELSVSHQFIGYLETGHRAPSELLVEGLAQLTGLEPRFFFGPPIEEFRDDECHFRRRATTPVSVRSRVLAHGTMFGMLVRYVDERVALPSDNVPTLQCNEVEAVERASERCRMEWGLGRDTPITNLTRAVERAGVVVTRFDGCSAKIDAFSRSGARHIIVLNTEKDSPSRTRFDLAHELGHLVMHGGHVTGDHDIEKEADRFASAMLLPRSGFVREFPRFGRHVDWEPLYRLKHRWGTSVAAMVRRAFDLRLLSPVLYQRAYKQMAAKGWLRGEPEELRPEQPELIPLSLETLHQSMDTPPFAIARDLAWTVPLFARIAGVEVQAGKVEEANLEGTVVQLDLARASRKARHDLQ